MQTALMTAKPDVVEISAYDIHVTLDGEPIDQPQQPHKPDSDPDESAPIDLWEQVVSAVAKYDQIAADVYRRFCSGYVGGDRLKVTLSSPALLPVIQSRMWLIQYVLMEIGEKIVVELIEPDTGSPPAIVPTPPKPGTGGSFLELPRYPYTA